MATDDAEDELRRIFEEEPIVELFSNPANVKILTVLNDAGGAPMSVASIVEQTDISRQAFYDNRDRLITLGLIEEAEKVGNANRYRVDMASDQMQGFMRLRDALIDAD